MRLTRRVFWTTSSETSVPTVVSTPVGKINEDDPFASKAPFRGVCNVFPYSNDGESAEEFLDRDPSVGLSEESTKCPKSMSEFCASSFNCRALVRCLDCSFFSEEKLEFFRVKFRSSAAAILLVHYSSSIIKSIKWDENEN
jgi:hypothetical protein